ncbi:hypothetical protein BDN67DRAFT_325587 [Paxillus ammoniavirescens]|nr:hypothetical protein BDN67DRAFT_325587 [Paxillus ammoniavirescens]
MRRYVSWNGGFLTSSEGIDDPKTGYAIVSATRIATSAMELEEIFVLAGPGVFIQDDVVLAHRTPVDIDAGNTGASQISPFRCCRGLSLLHRLGAVDNIVVFVPVETPRPTNLQNAHILLSHCFTRSPLRNIIKSSSERGTPHPLLSFSPSSLAVSVQ